MELEATYFGSKIEVIRIIKDFCTSGTDNRTQLQHLLLTKSAAQQPGEYEPRYETLVKLTQRWMIRHTSRSTTAMPFTLKYHVREGGSWNFLDRDLGRQLYVLQAVTMQGQHLDCKAWRWEFDPTKCTFHHLVDGIRTYMVRRLRPSAIRIHILIPKTEGWEVEPTKSGMQVNKAVHIRTSVRLHGPSLLGSPPLPV